VAEIRAKRAGRDKPADADRLPPWVIHDLRRTFRTNSSACRVDTDIKELLLGHAVGKLERTYDRWSYFDERLEALQKIEQRYDNFEAAARGNVANLRQA
jgi:integrase